MKKMGLCISELAKNYVWNKKNNLRLLFTVAAFLFSLNMNSQDKKISLKMEHVSLGEILKEIKKQSGKNILFNNNKVDRYNDESVNLNNVTLEEALKECLKGKNLKYKIVDEVIIIEPEGEEKNDIDKRIIYEQTIRGQVVDLNTGSPLIGATVILSGSSPLKGSVTDLKGEFELKHIPVGRQSLEVSYVGYNNSTINNIYLYAGKEFVITIPLEEKLTQFEDVVIKSQNRKDQPLNEMAQVSARSFTVEETEKYAGSFGDPSRMASSYAGVLTLGTQINDIVIRGNSTTGLLWRLEGLKIPNPNHFGSLDQSGGTFSMINNNVLSNSDFYTGAFPAEFGNATSGVFDLRLRKGNNEKSELLAQIGAVGFEAGLEGPFSKQSKGSYLVNYRYSTLGVIKAMGFDIGIFEVPVYSDLSFNINVPLKNNGKISFFGMGGYGSLTGKDTTSEKNRTDNTDLRYYMGFTGCNHIFYVNEKSCISTSAGISATQNKQLIDNRVTSTNQLKDYYWELYRETTFEIASEYRNKINSRNYLKIGLDFLGSGILLTDSFYLTDYNTFYHKQDVKGNIPLFQSYGEWKYRFNDVLSFVTGIHYQYSKFGNDHSIEPRFSIKWDFKPKQSLSLGIGRHSKLQPLFVYHYQQLVDTVNKVYVKPNENLKMTRSDQIVLGYNYLFNANHRFKIEWYYQYLTKVPVEKDSSFKSLINYGTSFSDYDYVDLVNKGTGFNYGTEITLEKFLSKGYYYLVTLSLFNSKYRASDGILRNTRFNTKYIFNMLGGYEWTLRNKRNTFGMDTRIIWAGGERKIPLNYAASDSLGKEVDIASRAYDEKFKDYFRIDFKIYFKINKKTSHTLALDILNITARENHFIATYDKDKNDYEEVSNITILPSILWRWNF
jgi:hypothetical protein